MPNMLNPRWNENVAQRDINDQKEMMRYEPRNPAVMEESVETYPQRMMQPAGAPGQFGITPMHQDFIRELAQIRVAKDPNSGKKGDISKDARIGAIANLLRKYNIAMPTVRELGGQAPMMGLGYDLDKPVPRMLYAQELFNDKNGGVLEDVLMRLPQPRMLPPGGPTPMPSPNALRGGMQEM